MAGTLLCACLCVHDDVQFLPAVLKQLEGLPVVLAVSHLDWQGGEGETRPALEIGKRFGAIVLEGEWRSEEEHRRAAYFRCRGLGYSHALTLDSDEIIEPALLDHLKRIAESDLADRVYVEWDTYWKYADVVIRPRERFTPCVLINLEKARYERVREFSGGRTLFLPEQYGIIHHLSYVGGDERIRKKISTWGHAAEVRQGWWHGVWQRWDQDPFLENLHPTHPEAYARAVPAPAPPVLQPLHELYGVGRNADEFDFPWPSIRVVIPAHNRHDDLDECLSSLLETSLELEIVVVDNGSTPPVEVDRRIRVLRNDVNEGFARASNQGTRGFEGELILFLNSDTVVTRGSLIELVRAARSSSSIAACGPVTNYSGHFQQVPAQCNSPEEIEALSRLLLHGKPNWQDSDMLVGFCLLVRRTVLDEVGLFDEQFGLGLFEDNDLCYRMRRAGFRLKIIRNAFVYHAGSKTFEDVSKRGESGGQRVAELFERNLEIFKRKWGQDIRSGFASHLSGLAPSPIQFDETKRPEVLHGALESARSRASISLCMIVKDEERVIADCLTSVLPFCAEVLILDTGSTDRTVDIAATLGAEVRIQPWEDSFAQARTESMKKARGEWIMWVDADDTLPFECGLHLLELLPSLPRDVVGVIVPVRFLEDGGFGTEVDHVKVFRNLPGLKWEGRIHEQILPSLRRSAEALGYKGGGRIIRSEAYVVHSGYDTSAEGQAKKRLRDEKLLLLDLEERPNHPFVLFNLGMTAHYTGDHAEAVSWLKKCLDRSEPAESHVRKAWVLLACSENVMDSADAAVATLEKALSEVGDDPEILFHLAKFKSELGQVEEAISLYQRISSVDHHGYFRSVDPAILGYKRHHNLALCYLQAGDYSSARQEWLSALSQSGRVEFAAHLFEAALAAGDLTTCAQMVDWIRAHTGLSESWARCTAQLMNGLKLDPVPLLSALVSENQSDACLRTVLATELLNSGRAELALPHLLALDRIGRPEGAFFLGVLAEEQGESGKAKLWFERSYALNPGHVPTAEKLGKLGE